MHDPEECALVAKAIVCRLSNTVLWKSGLIARILADRDLQGLTHRGLVEEMRSYIEGGGRIKQKAEDREGHRDRFDNCYMMNVPVEFLAFPVFVEMVLTCNDPEVPVVTIVSVHK